jgi:hypothetical protein
MSLTIFLNLIKNKMKFNPNKPELIFALWALGASFACYAASIVFWSVWWDYISGIIFTLVGVVFLAIGTAGLAYNSHQLNKGNYSEPSDSSLSMLISFLFIFTVILMVVNTIVIALV